MSQGKLQIERRVSLHQVCNGISRIKELGFIVFSLFPIWPSDLLTNKQVETNTDKSIKQHYCLTKANKQDTSSMQVARINRFIPNCNSDMLCALRRGFSDITCVSSECALLFTRHRKYLIVSRQSMLGVARSQASRNLKQFRGELKSIRIIVYPDNCVWYVSQITSVTSLHEQTNFDRVVLVAVRCYFSIPSVKHC